MKKLEHAPLTELTFACELSTVAQFDPSFCVNLAALGAANRGRGRYGAQRWCSVCWAACDHCDDPLAEQASNLN